MRVLVTGVNGQLGYDVCKELQARGIKHKGADLAEFDITDAEATHKFIVGYRPDVVIHCSAWTAVDKAEDELNTVRAVNTEGPRNIASACKEIDAKMLYISTDYVFPGTGERFYEPDDPTGPLSAYGLTKLGGETAVKTLLNRYFIVRISWVFGINGNNFVKTMLRLAETKSELNVVCDQIGSPTYTADLAPLLCDMIVTDKYGTYHATNEGICSWAEFAEEIFRLAGKNVKVNHIPTREYPTRAIRPLNSRMSKDKLEQAGFSRLPHWKDALQRFLKEILKDQ
nr:dTDP-4-dehydrorhamnose reductase [uncultured Agathobaculum sp.]